VLAPILAADAARRAGDRPQSLDRDRLSALSTQRTQIATIRRLPVRFFLNRLNKFDVLGFAMGASELVQETRKQFAVPATNSRSTRAKLVEPSRSRNSLLAAGPAY
jgi:hypothetical protein